jgi:hypothetical protein
MVGKSNVYISSTFKDLEFVRASVKKRFANYDIMQHYELSRIMEQMNGDGTENTPLDNCISEVKSSDIYFIIIGYKYGSIAEEGSGNGADGIKSYTEIEYDNAIAEEKNKQMHIYRICPSEKYLQSKQGETDKPAAFKTFYDRVRKNREVREYNSPEEIYMLIFDCLVENLCKKNFKLKLKYDDSHLNKIDRNEQINRYEIFREAPIDTKILPMIMLGFKDDMPEKMTARLIRQMGINQENFDIFRATISRSDPALQENLLLRNVTLSLLGQLEENCNFDKLPAFIKKFNVNSRFIVFEINFEQEIEYILKTKPEFHWVKLLSGFINRLNNSLGDDFLSRIYMPIHILFNKATLDKIDEESAMTKLKQLFAIDPGIPTLELGVLNVIEKNNLYEWLNNFKWDDDKEKEESEKDIDKIFKFINFPIRYNQCTKTLD